MDFHCEGRLAARAGSQEQASGWTGWVCSTVRVTQPLGKKFKGDMLEKPLILHTVSMLGIFL